MLKAIIIVGLFLFFGAKLLARAGTSLGTRARMPFRLAKWILSWFGGGSEAESIQAEREYGRECAREFAKQFPGQVNASNQRLVNAVGARLAAALTRGPRHTFQFQVVVANAPNAFALPGGFVFITEALLDQCGNDEAEIAFFLGHEMGHVLCGHAKERWIADALLKAVKIGAGPALRQAVAKGYARDQEFEADREGARLMIAAGFDRHAAARGLRRLAGMTEEDAGPMEFFSSHPTLADRLARLEKSP